jgi:signal transduction histidine kinase/PleD family two-component response regulator
MAAMGSESVDARKRATSSSPEPVAQPIASILLVDDQPARLLTYEALLAGLNVRCVRTLSGEDALRRLLQEEFAAIVMDVCMPGMDGFETARAIRERPRLERTPIIFVTGVHVSELDQLRGYEVGAIDYISVPVVPEIFRSKIALLVELFNRRNELANLNRELEAARVRLEHERNEARALSAQLLEERNKTASPDAVSDAPDIAMQKRIEATLRTHEARAAALLRLADQFRASSDPADLAYAAAEVLGETLAVSRCGYGTVDHRAETITIDRDWNARGSRSIAGLLHFREHGSCIDELKRAETVVCLDTEQDERTRATAPALRALDVRSFINMPIMEQDALVAVLFLTHRSARAWSDEELAFVREVAERARVAIERRRSERAVAADFRDTQLLRDLAARLVAEGDTQVLFDEVLRVAMTITEADGGTIQLLDVDELTFAATRGLDSALAAHFVRVDARSQSSCGQALARGTRTWVDFDVPPEKDPDGSLRLLFSYGLRCAQSTPLVSRSGRMLGMFSTHWRTHRTLSLREQRFLDLLARQAADLIERMQSEQALRASELELREGAKRKDQFLAVLAHELRNPLAAISAAAQLLLNSRSKPERAAFARDGLQRQVQHMGRLLDDLLDISRLTHGRVQLRMDCVNLPTIVTSAIEMVRPQLEAKQHRLDVQLAEGAVFVHGDAVRLTQVIVNLLHNAAKYTPPGGALRVTLWAEDAMVMIAVRDNGIGIPNAVLPRIFEMFSEESARHGSGGGLGIGLALVKGLVELHGGRVEATSGGGGQGSQFTIVLPLLIQSANEQPQATGRAGTVVTVPTKPTRILVADDNAESAVGWSARLEAQGHVVRTAFDGRTALEEAERFQPEVLLLDIGMPHMNGYEVAQKVRATTWGKRAVLVAIIGWGQAHDQDQAHEAGFDHHLAKPASIDDVEAILRNACG